MAGKRNHIYGPVLSRRLGVSVGIDIVPYKTCTYDCIYCQLGRTSSLTRCRAEYAKVETVLGQLERSLRSMPRPDHITLSGSGEPTLHSGIGRIIRGIRSITRAPVAVLTNGSLLVNKGVQLDCRLADIVLPSLDAGDEHLFQKVNRPMPGISFRSLVNGLVDFRRVYEGQIWLEVLLLYGITDNDAAVTRIAQCASEIYPDRIHLNTAVRPAPDGSVRATSLPVLRRFAGFFKPAAHIAYYPLSGSCDPEIGPETITRALSRRPCTLQEIARLMNLSPTAVSKITDEMVRTGRLRTIRHSGQIFYAASPDGGPGSMEKEV